jgi:hypothetical protein
VSRRRTRALAAQRVAVPLYTYPYPGDAAWEHVRASRPAVAFIVADPADGPGAESDPNYVEAIDSVRGSGIGVLGYITLSYGQRGRGDLAADVERWFAWYAIDGIFIDEAPTNAEHLDACLLLYDLIKRRGTGAERVVLNPGVNTLEPYIGACDILVNNESLWTTYRDMYPEAPRWTTAYPPDRFWHIIHDCGTEPEMRHALWLARARNAGWVYVTDRTGANAYDALPNAQYWLNELELARLNGDPRRLRVPLAAPPFD